MKCLVTGGCGFIGSHLVDSLVLRGDHVVVIDNLETNDTNNLKKDVDFQNGSVLDGGLLRNALIGVDCVFHMAALPRVLRSIEDPIGTHRVNVDGTLSILQAVREMGIGRFVYSSSSSVYGLQNTHLMSEDMIPNPLSPYALQKLIGEKYVEMFARLYGLSAVSLRYFNVYGPRQPVKGEYALVIGKFMELHRLGLPLTIYGDGEQTRAYSHVEDVVRANLLSADIDTPAGKNLIVNIGTRDETSVNQIAKMIGGDVTHVLPNPRGDMEEPRKAADSTLAGKVLGWKPTLTLPEGLQQLTQGG